MVRHIVIHSVREGDYLVQIGEWHLNGDERMVYDYPEILLKTGLFLQKEQSLPYFSAISQTLSLCHCLDSLDNLNIAGTAAKVPSDCFLDFILCRLGIPIQEGFCC